MHLFTGMVAIFNLLDLRSMMGYLGGPRSVFTLYVHFLGKKKTSLYISWGQRRSSLHPNTAQ